MISAGNREWKLARTADLAFSKHKRKPGKSPQIQMSSRGDV